MDEIINDRLEYYNNQLKKYGNDYPDEDALAIAKVRDTGWWNETTLDDAGYPKHLLDNFPGQHLYYRRVSYNEAVRLLKVLDKRYSKTCSCSCS